MDLKAIIFDLDGVIVDSAKYHFLAWRRLANKMGFDFTEEQNEELKGVSRVESLKKILLIGKLQLDEEKQAVLRERKNDWYLEYIATMTSDEILPGVLDFIHEVKAAGLKTSLGSASKNSHTILKQVGMIDLLDAIVDGNNVTKAKPDPEVFLEAAKALNTTPEYCIVFEDAIAGVEAANRAGMFSIGVGDAKVLSHANHVIPNMEGITLEKVKNAINL